MFQLNFTTYHLHLQESQEIDRQAGGREGGREVRRNNRGREARVNDRREGRIGAKGNERAGGEGGKVNEEGG